MKLIVVAACVAAYIVMQINTMSVDIKAVRTDAVKVSNTKAALIGTACMNCHGVDSGNMLPIRKTMQEKAFLEWVRGTGRHFVGYTACTAFDEGTVSTTDLKKIYNILYR